MKDSEVLDQARSLKAAAEALNGARITDTARLMEYNAAIVAALEERQTILDQLRRVQEIAEAAGGIAPEIDATSALVQIYDLTLEAFAELDAAKAKRGGLVLVGA